MKRLITILTVLIIFSGNIFAQGWTYSANTGTTFIIYGMSFPPNQNDVGYACGMQYTYNADGVIIKTTDGGQNWTSVLPTSGSIDGLQGIWFIDDNIGFAGGWNNYFIKTTDAGANWVPVTCGTDVWYYVDVEFWDANNGVAAAAMNNSSDQAVFITNDGGSTWTPATSGANVGIMGITYADQNTLFAVGGSGNIYKSTDGGHNWILKTTLSAMPFGVDFANASFGVVGGEEKMFATNDGGTSWTTYTTGYENFYATKAYANGTAYVGGTDENIYVTNDYGNTWSMDFNGSGSSTLYRIRDTQNGSLFACGSQGTIMIKEPIFSANFSASTDSVCEGNTVDFTDMSTGTITSWNWTFEGGTPPTSTEQNPTITYNTAGNYDVSLEISDGTNTNTTLVTDMIHVVVSLIAPSTPTGLTELCGGSDTQYTTTRIVGADSYYWEVDPADAGTISGTDTVGTFIADDAWTGNYTVKVKASNLCGWGPWSDTLSCTLNFNPYDFVLSEGGGYCSGTSGIEITQNGSEIGVDYELFLESVSTGIIISGTGNPISFGFQTDIGIYTVVGYSASCSENMVGTPYIFVEFVPNQASIPVGEDTVCQATTEDYSIDPIFDSDTIYWYLSPVDAGVIIGSGNTITIEWDTIFASDASLTAQGYNSCGYGAQSDPFDITVSATPTPVITGLEIVCNDEQADYSTIDNPGSTYVWTVMGGDIIYGAGTSTISVQWGLPGMGTVDIYETSYTDCVGSSEQVEVTIDDCTAINEVKDAKMNIYPNPTSGILHIDFSIDRNEKFILQIQNILGQVVKTVNGVGKGRLETQNISTLNMPRGQYVITISGNNGSYYHKNFSIIK